MIVQHLGNNYIKIFIDYLLLILSFIILCTTATCITIKITNGLHAKVYDYTSSCIRNLRKSIHQFFHCTKRNRRSSYKHNKKKSSRQYCKRHIKWDRRPRQYVYFPHNVSYYPSTSNINENTRNPTSHG